MQNSDAAGLGENLAPAVTPPAGCWYSTLLAAGGLARGRRAAGSFWDFKMPWVVHSGCYLADPSAFLLLSVPVLCFLTLLPLKQKVRAFSFP